MEHKFSKYLLGDNPPIQLNLPQLLMILAPQKNKVLLGGRGLGKSTVLGYSQKERAFQMPRCSQFLVGETYSQMLTRTLPSTIEGLQLLGYYKDVHYFVGRKAPAKWKWNEAYQPPLNYDHAIHWISGAVTHLISLDLKDDGKGLNTDGGDGDEAALLNHQRLSDNVLSTNRGNIDRFSHCPLHHSISFFSSMPRTNKGKWLYEYEKLATEYPKDYFFLRASAEYNRHNLGDDWFKERKRTMTDFEYNTEILNIQPGTIDGGFYGLFNDADISEGGHTYNNFNNSYLLSLGHDYNKAQNAGCLADADLQLLKPIDIALDYGARINTIVANQDYGNEARYLNALFIKSPDLLDVLINKFCDYYNNHGCKVVNYHYDHTAVFKDAARILTYADIVDTTFRSRGWTVNHHYHGQAPSHHSKYLFWGAALKGADTRLPKQSFNKTNCKYLIISIQQAGVREGKNGFEKDKRPEHMLNAIDEETTHFSDALDTLAYFKYANRVSEYQGDFHLPI